MNMMQIVQDRTLTFSLFHLFEHKVIAFDAVHASALQLNICSTLKCNPTIVTFYCRIQSYT